jgi:hypothetical protein
MRAAPFGLAVALAIVLAPPPQGADDGARDAAATFGRALTGAKAEALRPILPERGRVHLSLVRLGPEEGLFGAHQVEALFREFFAHGAVTSFDVVRYESDAPRSALAHAAAAVTDRDGRLHHVGLHLGFEPEGGRWVLREVKETAE